MGIDTTLGDQCLVAWPKAVRPVELGRLGVLDLATMGYAFCLRWECLERTEPNHSWLVLPSKPEKVVHAMFDKYTIVQVGNGARVLFWRDRWLEGKVVNDFIPQVVQDVCKNVRSSRMVVQAM
jgi:hypothetical protein